MNNSKNLANAIKQAIEDCDFWRHEFVTPEHVLYAFASQDQFASACEWLPHDASWLITQLEKEFLSMEVVPETQKLVIEGSQQFSEMMSLAIKQAQYSDQNTLDVPHVVAAMLMLNDSQAAYLLDQFTGDEKGEFMQSLVSAYAVDETGEGAEGDDDANSPAPWRKLVTCVNDTYAAHNPLIGSPAGYVGYEDGGLLTAAVRKTPNCVLLFDEIEKAHPDIFNIFLQMMDYAALTDNHGERADFRNAVIIMTSNAGAQYASRASIGFTGSVSRGDAMLTTVKKTFKPEFINRLTDIVVFHDMSRQMASLILDKKLAQLQTKLSAKNVTLHLSAEAHELLLTKGFTPEYGARELDRVIGSMLKPLLMKEMLFGRLKKSSDAVVDVKDGALRLV